MLKDSVGLIISLFGLIVCFAVVTSPVMDTINEISDANTHEWSSTTLRTALISAYYMMYGILGIGIFIWFYSRMHRDEYETDYFEQAGWQFKSPNVPQYPFEKMRRW